METQPASCVRSNRVSGPERQLLMIATPKFFLLKVIELLVRHVQLTLHVILIPKLHGVVQWILGQDTCSLGR